MAINPRTESEARRNLQRYLRQLSYFDINIPPVPIDGNIGSATTNAIRAYQLRRGLPVTGIADKDTWDALYADYLLSLEDNSPPHPFNPFPAEPKNYEVTPGDEGFVVSAIQYLLEELSVFYPIEAIEITGIYDEQTQTAIREVQKRFLLPVTGNTDKITWNALVRLIESAHLYQ